MRCGSSKTPTTTSTRCVPLAITGRVRTRAAVSTQPNSFHSRWTWRTSSRRTIEAAASPPPGSRAQASGHAAQTSSSRVQAAAMHAATLVGATPQAVFTASLAVGPAWQTMTQPRSANQMSSKKRVSDDSEYKCEMKRHRHDFTDGPPTNALCAFSQWPSSLLGTKRKPLEEVFPTRNVKRIHTEYDLHEIDAY